MFPAAAGAHCGQKHVGWLGVPHAGCADRAARPAGPRRGDQTVRQVPQTDQDTRQELLQGRGRH